MNLSNMSNNLGGMAQKSERSDTNKSMSRITQKSLVDRLYHDGEKKKMQKDHFE